MLRFYREQCAHLAGADALLLETFEDLREARAALEAAAGTGLPIVFQVGNTGGGPRKWERIDALLSEAHRAGAAAVGTNCRHPDDIVPVASYIAAHTNLPVTASPNAGHPRIERGLVTYEFTPDELADVGARLAAVGVAVVGGCCGTTPEHVRRLAQALGGRPVVPRQRIEAPAPSVSRVPEAEGVRPNPVRDLIRSSRFVISVEIRADRMRPVEAIVKGASEIAEAGADMFDVPDNPGATVGRDAMVTAARLQETLALPAIAHTSVTQANLMKLHSLLIGSWDLGLRGLLAITGDAPSMGHLGNLAHRVGDLRSSVELLRLIGRLREGTIINGEEVADPPDFCAGCAVGQGTPAQVRWLEKKVDAGAEFIFSQPVFTLDDYQRLRDAVAELPIRFFPGLMPLVSRRNAEFLAGGRIPGIIVPDEIVAAFAQYSSAEDQRRFGLEQAAQLAVDIARDARGLYLIMPFGKRCYAETAGIVRAVRKTHQA